jgi:hypothetical protein
MSQFANLVLRKTPYDLKELTKILDAFQMHRSKMSTYRKQVFLLQQLAMDQGPVLADGSLLFAGQTGMSTTVHSQ